MVEFQRPENGQWLFPTYMVASYGYHVAIEGNPVAPLELAFFVAMLLLVTVSVVTKELLDSPAYPLVGGTLIAVFYALKFRQVGIVWNLLGVAVGVLFGLCGAFLLRN